ncbi:serine protease [Microcoleus sp. Pol11C2]|uniref:serine protease n=1 Tax=Microcoleus sp. Pol11C2 TaxID=3055389 RepID=UPI002FCF0AD7
MILTIMILSRRGSSILSLFLALITAIGLILLSSPSQAIMPDDIDAMSSQTTVLIGKSFIKNSEGELGAYSAGSGVIVARSGNTYYAVTNTHVVQQPNGEGIWGVVTWDEKFHEVRDVGDNIIRFGDYQSREFTGGFDLALVKFTSNKDYPIAVMSNSEQIQVNDPVYLSGWPDPEGGGARIVRVFSPGKLVKIDNTPFYNGGYNIMYDNWTKGGMSGSSVFNQKGEVIGIHAAGRKNGNSYCIDPELNLNSSCGIQAVYLISQIEAKQIRLTFNPPPVNPSVISRGRANKAEADVIEDVYKIFNRVESQLRDCPTGVLIDESGCESL